MTVIVKICWLALAALHLMPAGVLISQALVERLYSVDPSGDIGLLLRHRGALFLGVVIACAWAIWEPGTRRMVVVLVTSSMVSFLWLYFRAGCPTGALRTIAYADLVGLIPLFVVAYNAWFNAD